MNLPEWCTPWDTPEPASLCSSQPAPALQEERSVEGNQQRENCFNRQVSSYVRYVFRKWNWNTNTNENADTWSNRVTFTSSYNTCPHVTQPLSLLWKLQFSIQIHPDDRLLNFHHLHCRQHCMTWWSCLKSYQAHWVGIQVYSFVRRKRMWELSKYICYEFNLFYASEYANYTCYDIRQVNSPLNLKI